MKPGVRICARCVLTKPIEDFYGNRGQCRQCSSELRREYNRLHGRAKSVVQMICAGCSKSFERTTANKSQAGKFCTISCSASHRPEVPLPQKVWPLVSIADGCWGWAGKLSIYGYGRVVIAHSPFMAKPAHVVVFEMLIGPVPDGLVLDHTCHTNDPTCTKGNQCPHRACVNPSHLEPVTPTENWRRGRSRSAIAVARRADLHEAEQIAHDAYRAATQIVEVAAA